MIEVSVLDDAGDEIFYSKSDAGDFIKLARSLLRVSAKSVELVTEGKLELGEAFLGSIRTVIDEIRESCDDLEKCVRSKTKKR